MGLLPDKKDGREAYYENEQTGREEHKPDREQVQDVSRLWENCEDAKSNGYGTQGDDG